MIESILEKAMNIENENDATDYIFDELKKLDYDDESILNCVDKYLDKTHKMQTGGTISSVLGTAKRKGYSVILQNI